MTTLLPDTSRRIFYETDVTPAAGLRPNDCYDLALYPERSRPHRGVLLLNIVLQFQFHDGESAAPATLGQTLRWTEPEKRDFALRYARACIGAFNNKHRITTTSMVPDLRDIGVQFNIRRIIDGWDTSDHWELSVTKVDRWAGSSVTPFTGNSTIDSQDTRFRRFLHAGGATTRQRGAVHEFGHMIGLRDEYAAAGDNLSWTGDFASVMNNGEAVRERHYANFAAWLTEKSRVMSRLSRERIEYKVAGSVDLSNARL